MIVWLAELRWALMVLCLVIFAVVFGVMLVSAWRQHRRGGEADNFHPSVAVEVSWAVAPLVIVVMLVWPAARAVFNF
ncbi:cytochrome c oxidase subunit II transmembrane domain-containing protein [Curvibacter sp. APW13]|uniref:cytochrome c oxidase subunit II transmembrane domain-containing protein n=1 Tax=Curvibacter sp. APW13 TaxID=3077236 RepID=UPI0028DECB29|nr:cytochrome c oxidase subunit II transmembrane domain-containing protein [Curvibacter sp. APW13]MDT8989661.1 cytochrome c oxidase subunit II transmembrane domain-containing protein [Curvibacter sp. APW13]